MSRRRLLPLLTAPPRIILVNIGILTFWRLLPPKKREFVPASEAFFADPIEDIVPENAIEKEYWHINDDSFNWVALRVLSRQNMKVFYDLTSKREKVKDMKSYMKEILEKLFEARQSGMAVDDEDEVVKDENAQNEVEEEDTANSNNTEKNTANTDMNEDENKNENDNNDERSTA